MHAGGGGRTDASLGGWLAGIGADRQVEHGGVEGLELELEVQLLVVELDGLFVEPAHMGAGLGRQLVLDAAQRAAPEAPKASQPPR